MNTPLTCLVLAAAALLSSCASPLERRMEHHPELLAKLSETDRQAVRRGQVHEGMSKDAVYLAWGRPGQVSAGKRDGKVLERWSYRQYEPVVTETYGFGFGVGYWGRHRGGFYDPYMYDAPAVSYVPVPGRWVEFVNGKVTGFLVPRAY